MLNAVIVQHLHPVASGLWALARLLPRFCVGLEMTAFATKRINLSLTYICCDGLEMTAFATEGINL